MGTQQQFQNESSNQNTSTNNNQQQNGTNKTSTKTITERGASWEYAETKLLLALWSQEKVQNQLTHSKRTRHVYEKISERIREHGYDRTAEQVRTRVFNMLAEYRRIMKNPTPERRKKCIFFDALHKIHKEKGQSVIIGYNGVEEQCYYNFDPLDFTMNNDENNLADNHLNGDDNDGDSDEEMRNQMLVAFQLSPSGDNNGQLNELTDDSTYGINDDVVPQAKRGRFGDSSINPDVYGNMASTTVPSSELDNSAAALLIDRMFTHLSKETEVMREWVNLERERLAQEVARRKEEKEREERREKSFLDALTKLQERVFNVLKQIQSTSCHYHNNNNINTIPASGTDEDDINHGK